MHPRFFTTFEASHFLGVSLPTIVNWIKANRLKAHRTPGGHRRIAREELASFIRRHGMPMPPELEGEGASARVMVIADDAAQAQQLFALLKRAGFEALPLADPFAAGLRLGLSKPDLVLLDFSMTAVDPAAVAAELRAHVETKRIPIVGLVREEKVSRKVLGTLDHLLHKPVDAETLRRFVDAALRARKAA